MARVRWFRWLDAFVTWAGLWGISAAALARGCRQRVPEARSRSSTPATAPTSHLRSVGLPRSGTKSFALMVDDRDDPIGIWVLWVLYGIAANIRDLAEGVPREDTVPGVGSQGLNDFGDVGYRGPRPPPGPAHLYVFRLYALDTALALPPRRRKVDLLKAVAGHILVQADLIGRYQRT